MRSRRVDIQSIRRQQIIDAAVAIITERGIQRLSLSEIEKRAGMSRGQLTYYFPAKEDILLAAFDRLIQMLREGAEAANGERAWGGKVPGWERVAFFLTELLLRPPAAAEFHSLQYTFLSQIAHREDFRLRLANLNEEWRRHLAEDFAAALATQNGSRRASPRTFATLVQALLHGLAMQRAADPEAFDPQEMLDLCLDLLGQYVKAGGANGSPAAAGPSAQVAK